nr:MAG: hypothetical protein [Molluscum contagiosum virus]
MSRLRSRARREALLPRAHLSPGARGHPLATAGPRSRRCSWPAGATRSRALRDASQRGSHSPGRRRGPPS